MLLRRQSVSVIKRCQHAIGRNRLSISSSTTCGGSYIVTSAIRTLSLYSTSTLQQNYNIGHTSSLQHVISRRIHKRQYHYHKTNNIINKFNANQFRQFSSSVGYHGTHHRGKGRNDRGRGHQSTNRIPMMKDCRTLDDAIVPYYHNLETLTPRNLSAFWAAVPRLLRYQERGGHLVSQLEAIFHKTADQIHSYGPKDLTTATLGFAKIIQALQKSKRGYVKGSYEDYLHGILVRQRDAVFSFLARTVVPKLHQFEPRYLKDLAYTYAILDFVPKLKDGSTLFDHIAEKSIPLIDKFNPQSLSNTVWAFEKVKVSHPTLYERVGDFIVSLDHLNDFNPQALSNILIAYAKAGVIHPNLFKKVGDHIFTLDHLNDFAPQALSNIVYAYDKAEVSHLNLSKKVASHIVALEHLNDFDSQALANIIWSYAKAEVSYPHLFKRVGDHIVTRQHLNDFTPQSLANIVWAFEKAEVSHPELFNKVGDHVVASQHLNDFTPQALSNIVWAFTKAGVSYHLLFNKVADHIAMIDQLNDFIPQELSNIVYSYAKAEVSHPCLFNKLANHIVSFGNINDFTPQALSNTVWSYAKAEISHPDLFYKVGEHIVSLDHLNDFIPQNLANIVYAYAKAGVSHHDLFNKVADHIVSLDNLDGYNEQSILNLGWAYNKAGIIRQDLNDKLIGLATDRKFSAERLETLNRWASEQSIENLEGNEHNGGGSVVALEDDGHNVDIEEEGVEDNASVSEDLSLLTVVQLKERLRKLGLRVSGRKQELIDRLNDHFQK